MLKVVKFGGSSLASAEQFKKAGDIVKAEECRRYVVPSAPGKRFKGDTKVTDMLYACYALAEADKNFSKELSAIKARYQEIMDGLSVTLDIDGEFKEIEKNFKAKAGKDYAASRGEYLNGKVMAAYLGFEFVDPAECILFDENGDFKPQESNELLAERLGKTAYAVIPGFYGAKADGTVTTFSRGGSDITGSVVSRAVNADIYENWTDVSGVMVVDPGIVPNPAVINTITYRELRELAYMGATVLHEDAIFPVRREGIPINIRNTNAPEDPGTMIVESTLKKSDYTITGIAGHKGFVSVNIEKDMMNSQIGYCRKILSAFEENGVSIEHMPSGIDTMTVFVRETDFEAKEQNILAAIHKYAKPDMIELESGLALIAVVGRGMKSMRGTAGRIFSALAHAKINVKMIDQGSSELNIIIGVKNEEFDEAIRAIYNIFVETQI